MYFSCQSDKYSLIISPLKIKFLKDQFHISTEGEFDRPLQKHVLKLFFVSKTHFLALSCQNSTVLSEGANYSGGALVKKNTWEKRVCA